MLVALKPYGSADWERAALADMVEVRHAVCRDESDLAEHARQADILLVDVDAPVTARVLESADHLRAIVCLSTGFDYVELDAATGRGILVTNLPAYAVQAVAEHTFALMFAVLRKLVIGDRLVREGRWAARTTLAGTEIAGKVLGIIGAGRIGLRVAHIGRALGMRVIAYSPYAGRSLDPADSLELYESLLDLLAAADVVSIHTTLRAATRGLIGRAELDCMQPDAVLVNVSRGPIVDQAALTEALVHRRIAGAALDVFDIEPPAAESERLLQLDSVVLSPHVGWYTCEARQRARETICAQVRAISHGETPLHVLNPDVLTEWRRRHRRTGMGLDTPG